MLEKDILIKMLTSVAELGFLSLGISIVIFAMTVILQVVSYTRPEYPYPTWFYNVWVFSAVTGIVCIIIGCVGYFLCVNFKK
jgi:lysylphosphatidylglycerol synthetase-like protein (DUF2156 family)